MDRKHTPNGLCAELPNYISYYLAIHLFGIGGLVVGLTSVGYVPGSWYRV